jgi:response regulator of citrate/malate metabolism
LEALDDQQEQGAQQARVDTRQSIIDKAGAKDSGLVRLQAEEVRFLTADEVKELIAAYEHGETMRSLAQRFGVHRTTISKLLGRR